MNGDVIRIIESPEGGVVWTWRLFIDDERFADCCAAESMGKPYGWFPTKQEAVDSAHKLGDRYKIRVEDEAGEPA